MKKIIFALMILTLSIDVHALTKNEKAFLEAAKNGDIETIRYLINSEVDIDVQDEYGATALIRSSLFGHFDIVKLLVSEGAYIDIKNNNGDTALMIASSNGNLNIVKLLVSEGAYIYTKNNYSGLTAIDYSKSPEILTFFMDIDPYYI